MHSILQVVVFVLYVAVCYSAVVENDVQTLCQDRGRRGASGLPEATANYVGEPEVDSDVPETPLELRGLNSAVGLPRFPSLKQKRCPSTHPRLLPRHVNDEEEIVGAETPTAQRIDLQNNMTKRFCKNCQNRPLCSVYKKCDQCNRWCTETDQSSNGMTVETTTKFEIVSNNIPLMTNSNKLGGLDETVALPNRFRSSSSESESVEDDKVSLATPSGEKRIYTIANFSSGPLKELICNLLGISNTTDIEKMVVWVTTFSNQPPKFAVEYKKNVSPLAEKLTDTLNDELKKAMDEKKKQGVKFLTKEEMEDIAQKILTQKPKDLVKAEKPTEARSSFSEEQHDFPKDDFDFSRKVNPDVIEDTLDPKLLEDTKDNEQWIGSVQKDNEDKVPKGNNLQQAMKDEEDKVQSPMMKELPNQHLTKDLMQQVKNLMDQRVKNQRPQPSPYLGQSTPLDATLGDAESKDQMEPKKPDTYLTKKIMQQMKDSMKKRIKNPKTSLSPKLGSMNDFQNEDKMISQQPKDLSNLIGSEQARPSLDQKGPISVPKTLIGREPTVGEQNIMDESKDMPPKDDRRPTSPIGASHLPENEGENSKPTPTSPITPADQLQDGLSKILQTLRKDSETMPRIIKDFDTAKEVLKDVENIVDEIRKEANIKPNMGLADLSSLGLLRKEEPSATPLEPQKISTHLNPQSRLQQKPLSLLGQKLGEPKEDIEDEKVGSQPIEAVPWDKHMTPSMMQRMNQRKNKDNIKLGSPTTSEPPQVEELADIPEEIPDPSILISEDEVPINQKTSMEITPHDEDDLEGPEPEATVVREPMKDMIEEESDLKVTPLDQKEMTQLPLHIEPSSKQSPQQKLLGQIPSDGLNQMEKAKPSGLQDAMRLRQEPDLDALEDIEEPFSHVPQIFPYEPTTIRGKEVPLKQKIAVQSSPYAGEDETVPLQTLLGQIPRANLDQIKKIKPSGLQDAMRLGKPNMDAAGNTEAPLKQKTTVQSSPYAGEDEMVPQQRLLGQIPSADLNQMKKIKPSGLQDAMRLGKPNMDAAGNIEEPFSRAPQIPEEAMTVLGKEPPLKQKTTVQSSPHAGEDEMVPQQTLLGQIPSDDLNQMKKIKPSGLQDAIRLGKPNMEAAGNIEEPLSHVPHIFPDKLMTIVGKEAPLKQKTAVQSSPHAGEDEMVPQPTLLGQIPRANLNQMKKIKPSGLQDAMRLGKPNMDAAGILPQQKLLGQIPSDDSNQMKKAKPSGLQDATRLGQEPDLDALEDIEEPFSHVPQIFPYEPTTIRGKEVPLKQKTTVQTSPHAGEDEMVPQPTLLGQIPNDDLNQMKNIKPSGLQDAMRLGDDLDLDAIEDIEDPFAHVPQIFPDEPMTIRGVEIPIKEKTTVQSTPYTGIHETVSLQTPLSQIPNANLNQMKKIKPSGLQDAIRLGKPNMDAAGNIEEPSSHAPQIFPDEAVTVLGKEAPLKQKTTVQSSPHAGENQMIHPQTLLGQIPTANLNQMKKIKPSGLHDVMRLGKPNMDYPDNIEEPGDDVSNKFSDQPIMTSDKIVPMKEKTNQLPPQTEEDEMVPQQTLLGQIPTANLNQMKKIKPSGLQDALRLGKPYMDYPDYIEELTNAIPQKSLGQTMPLLGKQTPLKPKSILKTSPQSGQDEIVPPNSVLGQFNPIENQIHPKLILPSRMQDIAQKLNQESARLGRPNIDQIQEIKAPIGEVMDISGNNEPLPSTRDPALQNRAEFPQVGSSLDEPAWSNSLGRLIPSKEDQNLSSQEPKGMYFVGNGIKLPLQMVRNNDGDVHLSVDLEKLCTCRNNSLCANNHTAMGQIVGTPMMNQLSALPKENQARDIEEDANTMHLGMSASKLEELGSHSSLVTPRIGRRTPSKWLDMKNSIARQVNPNEESIETNDNPVFKRDASLQENPPVKVSIPLTNDEGAGNKEENINQQNSTDKIEDVNTGSLESLHKFLNEKIMGLQHTVMEAERKNELKSQQLEESEENLMSALSSFTKDTKPKTADKLRSIYNIKSLFPSKPLGLMSRFKGNSDEEKEISNESHDILTPIKTVGNFKKTGDLQNKLDQFNEYVDKYTKENERLLKKEAEVLVKTQKNSFIKKEVDMMNNILKFLKSVATDKKD